jgi:hypothetical protein
VKSNRPALSYRRRSNSGTEDFEKPVPLSDPKPFRWVIDSPAQAQITIDPRGRSQGSLRIIFKASTKLESIPVSQTIVVEPETQYRIQFYQRTEGLITASTPAVVISDSVDKTQLVSSPPMPTGTNDWQMVTLDFKTKPKHEGISLRTGEGLPAKAINRSVRFLALSGMTTSISNASAEVPALREERAITAAKTATQETTKRRHSLAEPARVSHDLRDDRVDDARVWNCALLGPGSFCADGGGDCLSLVRGRNGSALSAAQRQFNSMAGAGIDCAGTDPVAPAANCCGQCRPGIPSVTQPLSRSLFNAPRVGPTDCAVHLFHGRVDLYRFARDACARSLARSRFLVSCWRCSA